MGNHALLSASSSHRWLNCPPSARLCEDYDDKGSDFAAEGTDAHALCEYKLRSALGMEAADPTENLSWYSAEILDHTVTFHFRDGHTESREFMEKRRGTPWTPERREKAIESMKAAWTDERKEAMSERIKKKGVKRNGQIRNDNTCYSQPVYGGTD